MEQNTDKKIELSGRRQRVNATVLESSDALDRFINSILRLPLMQPIRFELYDPRPIEKVNIKINVP